MSDGFIVDPAQLRSHAAAVEQVKGQFAAVKGASAHIAQDDAAYGLLCGWIAGILEGRHRRQDELIAYVEENLTLLSDALRATAAEYEQVDKAAADRIRRSGGGL
ncbi:type VII secretion target [Actinoplanes sp. NPDC051633]|uniref:type VII secretion target n=1 Tax=Actinoplanes sp. NPDC051633 TaxID=3155670 RepID=UPI003444CB0B